jgi:hypothetical protein
MGADRSLDAVARKLNKSRSLLARWSVDWSWTERAEAYDRHLNRLALEAQTQALAEEVRVWEERRAEQRDREWQMAEVLLQRATQMAQHPITETIEDEGRTIIMPARWSQKDIAYFIEVASKLARRAAEMEDDGQKVDARLKKEFTAFYDTLKAKLPPDLYWLVVEKIAEASEDA